MTLTPSLPPEGHCDFPLDFHWRTKPGFIAAAGVSLAGHPRAQEARNSIMTSLALAGRAGRDRWVSYSRSKRFYQPLARYEGTAFTYDRILAAVDELGQMGLIEEQRALPSEEPSGWQSRMRATERLLAAFDGAPVEHVGPRDVLELRDEAGNRMQYLDTERTRRLRRAVEARNEALRGIRIEMPEGDGWVHTPGHVSAQSEKGKRGWAHIRPTPAPHVVRIYGRGRWDMHGRLYGWWQQLPEDRRAELLINGEAAYEADWSACHPTLLYAMAGAVPVGDVYKVEGFHRDHGKAALNRAINCKSLNGAVLSLLNDEKVDPGSWPHDEAYTRRLVNAVADRNSDIRQYLGSDAGIRLMHIESEMCMEVLRRCERQGIPALPVHDGFVTQDKKRAEVTAIMAEVMDATRVAINPCSASRKAGFPPHMGAVGGAGVGAGASPSGNAKRKAQPVAPVAASSEKGPGNAVSRPVRRPRKPQARPFLPTAGEALPASWDLSERTLALVEDYQAAVRARHRKVALGAASGWGQAPTASERRLDLRQARQFAEVMAEEEERTGVCVAAGVPYALSDEAKAKRERRIARETRRPGTPVRPRRPSTYWAKPKAPPAPLKAKPQGSLPLV
ncbi:hypothetical protein [Methylorubrum thiocyanatum]|uniref:hypothetical protein n=1 Tax=Methylorubrum thiocyanatum TaxID=47958 RepID=UPI003F8019CE